MDTIRRGAQVGPLPPIAQHRRTRLSAAQGAVLDRLAAQSGPCTVTALAQVMHQHPNTVREHLDALVTVGTAVRTSAPTTGPGRPAWLYAATTESLLSEDAHEYARLAAALAGQIARSSADPAADADAAGREWGRDLVRSADAVGEAVGEAAPSSAADLGARRRVVALFDTLGFSPEADATESVVRLRRCPLLAAARLHPEVVCGVHLGLVKGALSELGAPIDGLRLTPFAEPGACLLHLTADVAPGAGARCS